MSKCYYPFLVGGTQTNQVVINSMLESYEGVISADTGHVAVHEGGAIEYSGHKVITIPSKGREKLVLQMLKLTWRHLKVILKGPYGIPRNGIYFSSHRIWHIIL